MNLAEACVADDHGIRFREVPYCAQLFAQLQKWHSIIWIPKTEKKYGATMPGARRAARSGLARGFRRDSIPHRSSRGSSSPHL